MEQTLQETFNWLTTFISISFFGPSPHPPPQWYSSKLSEV